MTRILWTLMGLALVTAAGCGEDTEDTEDTDSGAVVDNEYAGIQGVNCNADRVCTLGGTILDDLTLKADYTWVLRGGVFIGDDEAETVLTIEPGTTIYGETVGSVTGMLVITRHSDIIARGTADAPIVFTSAKAEGSRARGDWGGLIINGLATTNNCAEDTPNDWCESYGEGGTGWYGGDDDSDSSGVIEYVRVEFAGRIISPDNELNGIAFQAVGSGTTVDYIQVHQNKDDGVEFFGGNAHVKHVLVTAAGDDSMDWTDGWRGKAQFVVLQQYGDTSDNGFEADNNAEANDLEPRSMPTISNVTIIGSPTSEKSDIGMLLREGTAGHISNAIVQGFEDACLALDHDATVGQVDAGNLTLTHTLIHDCGQYYKDKDYEEQTRAWFESGAGNQIVDPELADPYNESTPGFAPSASGPAASGASVPSDSFFDSVTYMGAVDPADDWTVGWTTTAPN